MAIGNDLKLIRISRGLSQRHLAALTGLSQPAISYIESGKNAPALQTVELIAKILGASVEVVKGGKIVISENKNDKTPTEIFESAISKYGANIKTSIGTINIQKGSNVKINITRAGVNIVID